MSLKIVFAGTPVFSVPYLEAISHTQHQIVGIFTQPDKPAGRGRQLQASPVKQWGVSHNITVYQPETLKDSTANNILATLAPDVLIVIAYGLILPAAILGLPRFGCLNVHASLLPKWRGASPIQHAILSGDDTTGITIMQMATGMDTGPIITQTACPILPDETAQTLHDKLSTLGIEALIATINELEETGSLKLLPQDDTQACYAGKINKSDGKINWQEEAIVIDRKIRAFFPWPIAYTGINNITMRILKATVIKEKTHELPGTLLKINKHGALVATGHNSLLIQKIQFPGGKPMHVAQYLNAHKTELALGVILK